MRGAPRHAAKPRRRAVAVGEVAARLLSPLIARRAGMTAQLLAAWSELVGEPHGAHSRPEKILWPRRNGADEEFVPGTLVIACDGAQAVWLQHETGQIIERINRFFGFAAIERVRIVQKPLPGETQRLKPRPELDENGRRRLQAVLSNIAEPGLRERLRRLGEGVYSRSKPLTGPVAGPPSDRRR